MERIKVPKKVWRLSVANSRGGLPGAFKVFGVTTMIATFKMIANDCFQDQAEHFRLFLEAQLKIWTCFVPLNI